MVTPWHVPNTWYHRELSSFQCIPYQKLSPFRLTGWLTRRETPENVRTFHRNSNIIIEVPGPVFSKRFVVDILDICIENIITVITLVITLDENNVIKYNYWEIWIIVYIYIYICKPKVSRYCLLALQSRIVVSTYQWYMPCEWYYQWT